MKHWRPASLSWMRLSPGKGRCCVEPCHVSGCRGLAHPLFLSFSLWRRDAGSGVRVGVIEGPGTLLFSGPCGVRLFPWRGAVLCGTMSRLPVTEACPSPLPVLLPLEKGRGDTRLGSGERSRAPTPPLAPPRRFPVSSGLDLVVSSLHRLIGSPHNEAAFPTSRAPPPPRHHQTSPVPHPLFLSFSLWRRDAGSGVQVGALERPGIVPVPGLRCIPTAYSTATLVWTMPSACRSSSRSRTSDSRVARSTSYSVSSRSQICSGVTGVSESISQMRAPTSSSP